MSDNGQKRGGGYKNWMIALAGLVGVSPFLGFLIDVFILFPRSSDAHGHGVPVFTILLPLFVFIVAGIAMLVFGVTILIVKASAGKSTGRTYYEHQEYEYLKIFQKCDGPQVPAMILHEIDSGAGRCSVRCIYIYQNGYVENFVNSGVYVPVPTVETIQASGDINCQSAYTITGWEFENIWNSGHCAQS